MKFAGGPYRPSAARLEELISKIKVRNGRKYALCTFKSNYCQ